MPSLAAGEAVGFIVPCQTTGNKANNIGKFGKIINIMAEEVGQNKSSNK